ncbi:dihydrofolate reductase family protein [Enteractinococcus fodinae]|uniref:Dihydrofolate reductase n=1 Tax=Enteractinococcus fodinae TaxID=684663 RepID=A0ABU2B145_9MICC|nr:dihydrofolate reductase family protein [Enteractinococcus fodinae]MDR7346089.1 dihydrofolate reductase [Enteractinococcus fodinae]
MAVTANLSISLDGYYTGPSPSSLHPLGHGGEPLHDWFAHNGTSRHQLSASDILAEELERLGAMVMGRDSYDHAQAEWGDSPPFEVPVFVVTHRAHPDDVRDGTTFHFVTDGFSAALARAQESAGPKDVVLHGGGPIRQALRNGSLNQLQLHIVPMLLRSGRSLFESLGYGTIKFDQDRAVAGRQVTHLRYRVRYGHFSGTADPFSAR